MRTTFLSTLPIAAAALLAACGNGLGPGDSPRIDGLPRQLSLAENRLIEADNRFAFTLFREINRSDPDTNLFVSPLSVAMALGMTYNGAAGTTKDAMQQTLELQGMSLEEVNESYRSLIDLLRNLDPRVEFILANSIWYRDTFVFEQAFLDVNRRFFDAEVAALDFASPSAAQTINAWVRERTASRIDEIVPAVLPEDAIMYLINAIYFKGDWTFQFDRALTAPAPFTLADGSLTSVDMMSHEATIPIRFASADGVRIAELSYGGDAFRMTVVIPTTAGDIDATVDQLSQDKWNDWIAALDSTEIFVSLPKFTVEYEITLNDVLKAMGMGIAFSGDSADFTKLYSGSVGRAYISNVKHKTFVDVNEEGTEAAAATSVEVGVTSAPPRITVDRPFLFTIREIYSGTILFMGKILHPGG